MQKIWIWVEVRDSPDPQKFTIPLELENPVYQKRPQVFFFYFSLLSYFHPHKVWGWEGFGVHSIRYYPFKSSSLNIHYYEVLLPFHNIRCFSVFTCCLDSD